MKPFTHEDDHYYYIIHPDHIKNYIGEFMNNDGKNIYVKKQKIFKKNKLKDLKTISYHDVDNQLPFPNEFKVTHEFQKMPKFKENDDHKLDMNGLIQQNSNLIHKQDATYVDSPHWVKQVGEEEENSNINDLDHQKV